jgi:23S rRNA (guanosine2251-2'-O)-methyltransferase
MYVYGKNVAKEFLKKPKEIKKIYLQTHFNDKEITDMIKNIPTEYVDKKFLDNIEEGSHQGIVLDVQEYKYKSIDEITKNDVIIMLDHLEDSHNFGAIIRTCEAAGLRGIIIPKDRSVKVNAAALKTSAGALENVDIAVVTNLNRTIKELKDQGYWIIGTDMAGTDFKKIDYKGKIVLVIGSEGSGLSRLTKESCDFIASIPMNGKVNSLNASVAAALVIYEAVRNR